MSQFQSLGGKHLHLVICERGSQSKPSNIVCLNGKVYSEMFREYPDKMAVH